MDFYQLIAFMAGFLGIIVSIPQAYKIYKTKESKDVSLEMFLILATLQTMWLIYGFHIKDMAIYLSNIGALTVTMANITLIMRYRNGESTD
jgi:MtN3 and saliva related transmembrane protein